MRGKGKEFKRKPGTWVNSLKEWSQDNGYALSKTGLGDRVRYEVSHKMLNDDGDSVSVTVVALELWQ